MTPPLQLANDHLAARTLIADRAGRRASSLWRRADPGALDASWDRLAPVILAGLISAQTASAGQAEGYVTDVMEAQGFPTDGPGIDPAAFAGVGAEGLEAAPTLYGAVTQTKTLIGRGMGVGQAFAAGASMMQVLASTLVHDAGRAADKVAGVAKGGVLYARVVQPGACSRCAIQASVGYYTKAFQRHPGCRCQTIPVGTTRDTHDFPDDLFTSPEEYFKSLDEAEQDRVFTRGGAAAIRAGADPISVVNARRGMLKTPAGRAQTVKVGERPDGTPILGFVTREGTTRRGQFGRRAGNYTRGAGDRYRRTQTQRLMPETIMQWAADDPNRAVQLLKHYGYIR